jgi:hypothetical protein
MGGRAQPGAGAPCAKASSRDQTGAPASCAPRYGGPEATILRSVLDEVEGLLPIPVKIELLSGMTS